MTFRVSIEAKHIVIVSYSLFDFLSSDPAANLRSAVLDGIHAVPDLAPLPSLQSSHKEAPSLAQSTERASVHTIGKHICPRN